MATRKAKYLFFDKSGNYGRKEKRDIGMGIGEKDYGGK